MNRLLSFTLIACAVSIASYAEDDSIRLIVRADDMGCGHAVNQASIQSYREGIVRTVEVMAPTPWFNEAVELINQNPGLDIGVHLTLTSEWSKVKWRPLTPVISFIDSRGWFFPMTGQNPNFPAGSSFIEAEPDLNEFERELRTQIQLAVDAIPAVSHLSAHMGTATCMPRFKAIVDKLADEFGLPIDLPEYVKRAPRWSGNDKTPEEKIASLVSMLESLEPGTWLTVEHPGYDTPEMQAMGHTGYENVAIDREGVTQAFCSPRVKEVIERRGIELISYADVLAE